MAVFKCKMCGGALDVNNNETVATCEYCGTAQTLPRLNDDKISNLYDRANHFRRSNEYDKATGIYEHILNEDATDAEAYWSLVLCRYGIEYVEDPASHKRVPTVNRAQFTSIFDDDNYKLALQYADSSQKVIYEEEAETINEIQKGILAISQKEEPFDVFICYKETDNNGRRTPDSVLANDLYHQLTQEGFKVFFSRITLEDKLGTAYEPYIFAALNSSKAMVVIGTKQEYFNAVWVKNEWSRYLALIKNGDKKTLIPAYRDMDPYDLPEEFSHLQAQDMSKLGFMQDLIRGIKKIVNQSENSSIVTNNSVTVNQNDTLALIKRAYLSLEDKDWNSAEKYAEKALDINPECAEAYLVKLLVEIKLSSKEALKSSTVIFSHNPNYTKAIRFADKDLKGFLTSSAEYVNNTQQEKIYNQAKDLLSSENPSDIEKAKAMFESIFDYENAEIYIPRCDEKIRELKTAAEEAIKNKKRLKIAAVIAPIFVIFIVIYITVFAPMIKYNQAVENYNNDNFSEACDAFYELGNYKDSSDLLDKSLCAEVSMCIEKGYSFYHHDYVKERHYAGIYKSVETAFNKKSGSDYGYIEHSYIVNDILKLLPSNYEKTSDMMRLCEIMENGSWSDGGDDVIAAFSNLFEYEGPRDFIINRSMRDEYLKGNWTSGDYYFKFTVQNDGRTNSSSNLPCNSVEAAYYNIVDFEYKLYDNNDKEITAYFKFTPKSKNLLEVYCYKNGQTYTLTRS